MKGSIIYHSAEIQHLQWKLEISIKKLKRRTDRRLNDLKEIVMSRDYHRNEVNTAINKAMKILRGEALRRVVRDKSTDRVCFVVTYDPRLPSITKIEGKHWRTMVQEPRLKEIFSSAPLVAYKRRISPGQIKDAKTTGQNEKNTEGNASLWLSEL